jgi:hypothetical protein
MNTPPILNDRLIEETSLTVPIASEWQEEEGQNVVVASTDGVNLVISNPSAPSSIGYGTWFSASWTVTDTSNAATSATWYDRVYLSADETIDDLDDLYLTEISADQYNLPLEAGGDYTVNLEILLEDYRGFIPRCRGDDSRPSIHLQFDQWCFVLRSGWDRCDRCDSNCHSDS